GPSTRAQSQRLTRILVECVIDRELPRQSFVIGKPQSSKALRDGPQGSPFDSNLFLALDVGCTDDQCEPCQSRGLKMVVLNDRFETAAWTAVVKFDCRQMRRVERDRFFSGSALQQLALINKKKLGVRVDEVSDQPRASDPIHFDVFTSNPFHDCSRMSQRLRDWFPRTC